MHREGLKGWTQILFPMEQIENDYMVGSSDDRGSVERDIT